VSFSIPPDFCTTIVGHSKIITNNEPTNHSVEINAVTAGVGTSLHRPTHQELTGLFWCTTPSGLRDALLNTLETGWTVLPPPTNLAAKSKEVGCLQCDRIRTKAWFCGRLLLALSGRNQSAVSHSVVVERLSPARVGASSNWGRSRGSLLRCGSIP
jgi:hypothetical protein